jgi:hypothetical protein
MQFTYLHHKQHLSQILLSEYLYSKQQMYERKEIDHYFVE